MLLTEGIYHFDDEISEKKITCSESEKNKILIGWVSIDMYVLKT